jgi:uncharacterized protein YndB with AHSA1/START domain
MDANNEVSKYKKLHFEYTYSVPRETVWEAWTNPIQFAKWYAPDSFTIPVCELDARTGGKLRVDMQGPDGTMYPSSGLYREVRRPDLLRFTNSPLDYKGDKLFEVLQTIRLTEAGSNTTVLSLTSEVVSAGPNAAPYLAGMEMGLKQALQKFQALVTAM